MGDIIVASLSNDRLGDIAKDCGSLGESLETAASDAGSFNSSQEVCPGFTVVSRFSGSESYLFLVSGGDMLMLGRDKIDMSTIDSAERTELIGQLKALAKALDHTILPIDTGLS